MVVSIDATITSPGVYQGLTANLESYTVSEEATPLVISDTAGSVPNITFSILDDPSRLGGLLLTHADVAISDTLRGETVGKITSLSANNGVVTATASGRLSQLVAIKSADNVSGTFGEAITYYLGLCDLTTNITIASGLASIPVVAVGWNNEDVWTHVKELCSVVGAELAEVDGTIVVRQPLQQTLTERNIANLGWSVEGSQRARSVTVNYYNSVAVTNQLVHPLDVWTEDTQVLTVDTGETTVVNLPAPFFLSSLVQPTAQDYVSKSQTTSSVYAIVGSDNLPIKANQWLADGGSITVAIGEDRMSIDVTLTGAVGATAKYAPYRVAVSADGTDYSSLRLLGSGVRYVEESVTVATGAASYVTQDSGATVANRYVATRNEALRLAMAPAAWYGSATPTISFTIQDAEGITGQHLGNIVGARVRWRRGWYRIVSVSTGPDGVDCTAVSHTTFNDLNVSGTYTFNDMNTENVGLTFDELALAPITRSDPEYDTY